MKVLLVNGSPHQHGCTYTALAEIAHTLQEEGIASEIFWIGNKPIGGCIGCHGCVKLGKCGFDSQGKGSGRVHLWLAGTLRSGHRQYDCLYGPGVLFRRLRQRQSLLLKTRSSSCHRPPGRHNCHPGPTEQVLYHCSNAGDLLPVLEYGSRLYPGGCDERPGGSASDAGTGTEYGLLLKMQGRRCRRWRGTTQNGASHSHQLY